MMKSNQTGTDVAEEVQNEMRDMLLLHNSYELKHLCMSIGIKTNGRNVQKVNRIFNKVLKSTSDYHHMLSLVWEGTLIEYLRSVGVPMKISDDTNPKETIIEYWSSLEDARPLFSTVYKPEDRKQHRSEVIEDAKIIELLHDLKEHATMLAKCEHRIRREKDCRNVQAYCSTLSSVRLVERDGRQYLIDTLEKTVFEIRQMQTELKGVSQQLCEMEEKHEGYAMEERFGNAVRGCMLKMYFDSAAMCSAQCRIVQIKWDKTGTKINTQVEGLQSTIANTKEKHRQSAMAEQEALERFTELEEKYKMLQAHKQTLDGKFRDLQKRIEINGTTQEIESDYYFSLAANESAICKQHELRRNDAITDLLKMLRADNPAPKSDTNVLNDRAEDLLLALKVFDKNGLQQKKEQIAMWKEELAIMRSLALIEAKKPKPKKKKGKKDKKAKKKGKKGKGKKGKKGKGKGKKGKGKKKGKKK